MPYSVILANKYSKEAAPEAASAVTGTFPLAQEATKFIDSIKSQLEELGIKKGNCIALVSTCRDEASRVLDCILAEKFGLLFNLHGLAGVPPGGVLAVQAGMHHSPVGEDGRERYIFFGISHIGIDETGAVGKMQRLGRPSPSGACGALHFLSQQFTAKAEGPSELPEDNAELYFLRSKLEAKSPEADLVSVTNATVEVINDTLESLISKAVNPSKADYAVITGLQIHSGINVYGEDFKYENVAEFFVPSKAFAVISGEKEELAI